MGPQISVHTRTGQFEGGQLHGDHDYKPGGGNGFFQCARPLPILPMPPPHTRTAMHHIRAGPAIRCPLELLLSLPFRREGTVAGS